MSEQIFDIDDPFLHNVEINPGDIDGQGHVNNAVYLRWMDLAAYAHSCALGYDWEKYQQLGATFVVRRHEVDYFAPALSEDRIVVATWPCDMHRFTAYRRHQIVRGSDAKTLVKALTKWVFVDLETGRPRRMPKSLIDAFRPRTSGKTDSKDRMRRTH